MSLEIKGPELTVAVVMLIIVRHVCELRERALCEACQGPHG